MRGAQLLAEADQDAYCNRPPLLSISFCRSAICFKTTTIPSRCPTERLSYSSVSVRFMNRHGTTRIHRVFMLFNMAAAAHVARARAPEISHSRSTSCCPLRLPAAHPQPQEYEAKVSQNHTVILGPSSNSSAVRCPPSVSVLHIVNIYCASSRVSGVILASSRVSRSSPTPFAGTICAPLLSRSRYTTTRPPAVPIVASDCNMLCPVVVDISTADKVPHL